MLPENLKYLHELLNSSESYPSGGLGSRGVALREELAALGIAIERSQDHEHIAQFLSQHPAHSSGFEFLSWGVPLGTCNICGRSL